MNDILNDLIHLNLEECREVLLAVKARIKILEERQTLGEAINKSKTQQDERFI